MRLALTLIAVVSSITLASCDKSSGGAEADAPNTPTAAPETAAADATPTASDGPLTARALLDGAFADYACVAEGDSLDGCGVTCNEGFSAKCGTSEGEGAQCGCYADDAEDPHGVAKSMCSCPTSEGALCIATGCTADAPAHCDCHGAHGTASICGCGSDWAG